MLPGLFFKHQPYSTLDFTHQRRNMTDQDGKDTAKHLQEQAQTERTERAYAAIHAGSFQITRTSPFQWTVRNGDKLPYVVSLQPLQGASQGEVWSCTCKDFQQRGPDLRCKHIGAT
jgi:hypothetical protein